MKRPVSTILLFLLIFSMARICQASWLGDLFGNKDYQVKEFQFEMTIREDLKILELEVVQQKCYAMFLHDWAIPKYRVIQTTEKNLLDHFSRNGKSLTVVIKAGTMGLEEYQPDTEDTFYWLEEFEKYGIDLVRADFDIKILARDNQGKLHKLRIRTLADLSSKDSLKKVKSKKLTEYLVGKTNGLQLMMSEEDLRFNRIKNAMTEEYIRCDYKNGDFVIEDFDFGVSRLYGCELIDIKLLQKRSYAVRNGDEVEVRDTVEQVLPCTVEHSKRMSRVFVRGNIMSLEKENPNSAAGGTLYRVDVEMVMKAKDKTGQVYRCHVEPFAKLKARHMLLLAVDKNCTNTIEKRCSYVVLRLTNDDIEKGKMAHSSLPQPFPCSYEKLN